MLMGTLMKFIIGSADPASFIKEKDGEKQFVPFYESKFGSMLIEFYDGADLSVHVELMNQIVKYWSEVGMPKDLLEACFFTLFDRAIVYDDCLDAWKDQDQNDCGCEGEGLCVVMTKAVVRLNNVLCKIQEVIESREEDE